MRASYFLSALASALVVLAQDSADASNTNVTQTIVDNAAADSIALSAVPGFSNILAQISAVYTAANISDNTTIGAADRRRSASPLSERATGKVVDMHGHCVPSWYSALVPTTGGSPTPAWNMTQQLAFMASEGISRSVIAFSTPGANVFRGDQLATIALARLINEQTAAYARAYPDKFAFYAVVPLPYTQAAIAEATYALDTLGAAGIVLFSNFEGKYLGNPAFTPFFEAMNARGAGQIFFVHPSTPYLVVDGQFVEANPTTYPSGTIEFYFETARTLEDLAVSQTLLNFTNLEYVIPHSGGAWASTIDRLLKAYPAIYQPTLNVLTGPRFWWDSAGPTYYHQVEGLLAYGVPPSQLLFGTDYPYAPGFTQTGSLAAVQNSQWVNAAQKAALLSTNAETLLGSRLPSA